LLRPLGMRWQLSQVLEVLVSKRYIEAVIEGSRGWELGFISGFLYARGLGDQFFDAEKEGFDCESLRERLQDLFRRDSGIVHLLLPENLIDIVREAISMSEKAGHPAIIRHERPIQSGRFGFSVRIYSREHAQRIRALFENLPKGLKLTNSSGFKEHIDESAKGIELYAPAHEYELKGEGTVEGELEPLILFYRSCLKEELVNHTELALIGE
jgi:hypothetical protein